MALAKDSRSAPAEKPVAPTTARPLAPGARPLIVDTDMAPDDWLAILYLLSRSEVDVKAITVTGAGEARCPAGTRNALNLLALAGRPEIPVARGRETPLAGNHAFPTAWRDRSDGLLGLALPENPATASDLTAVELINQVIAASPEPVHLLALGPLTNVAEALEQNPALVRQLAMITVMGGAVRVPGNVGPSSDIANDVAEWNIYADPRAAALALASGAPLTLVPLDATNHVPVTWDFYRRLEQERTTAAADFVYQTLGRRAAAIDAGSYYFWDPLTAAVVVDESLATFEKLGLTVVEEEGPLSGQTVEDPAGRPIRVALWADAPRFEETFLQALNGRLP